jgi:ubiquinol-cytochrome c reductase cytochrome c subunit
VSSLSARRRHPMAPVAVLLLALLALGVVYAALAPTSRAQVQAQSSTQIDEGQRLFAIGCASCHGLGGEGQIRDTGEVLGPSLVGVGAASVNFQVGTGRMPMSAPGAQAPRKEVQYTEDQIDALAAYVASLAPGPPVPTPDQYDPEQGDPSHGGVLYRTNCASCHNTTGQGGALTYGKYAPALTGVEPIHMYQAMITGPQSMPVFNDQVLTPEDKRDIIAYLQTVEAAPNPGGLGIGRIGPVSEGLWAWIIGIGGLIGAAVWIGTKAS